jgi:hypothetical protein
MTLRKALEDKRKEELVEILHELHDILWPDKVEWDGSFEWSADTFQDLDQAFVRAGLHPSDLDG